MLGDTDGEAREAEGDPDADTVLEPVVLGDMFVEADEPDLLGVTLGVKLGVADAEPVNERVLLGVTLGVALGVADAETSSEADLLGVTLGVTLGAADAEAANEPVLLGVTLGVTFGVTEDELAIEPLLLGVLLGVGVADALGDTLAAIDRERLAVDDCSGVGVGDGVNDAVALPLSEADRVALGDWHVCVTTRMRLVYSSETYTRPAPSAATP